MENTVESARLLWKLDVTWSPVIAIQYYRIKFNSKNNKPVKIPRSVLEEYGGLLPLDPQWKPLDTTMINHFCVNKDNATYFKMEITIDFFYIASSTETEVQVQSISAIGYNFVECTGYLRRLAVSWSPVPTDNRLLLTQTLVIFSLFYLLSYKSCLYNISLLKKKKHTLSSFCPSHTVLTDICFLVMLISLWRITIFLGANMR